MEAAKGGNQAKATGSDLPSWAKVGAKTKLIGLLNKGRGAFESGHLDSVLAAPADPSQRRRLRPLGVAAGQIRPDFPLPTLVHSDDAPGGRLARCQNAHAGAAGTPLPAKLAGGARPETRVRSWAGRGRSRAKLQQGPVRGVMKY